MFVLEVKVSHDDGTWLCNVCCYTLMRRDQSAINVKLILELNVLCCHGETIDANPLSNSVFPADNRALDETVPPDLCSFHDCGVVDTLAGPDCNSRANHDIGTELGTGVNLC